MINVKEIYNKLLELDIDNINHYTDICINKGIRRFSFPEIEIDAIKLYNTDNICLHLRCVELYYKNKRIENNDIPEFQYHIGKKYLDTDVYFEFNKLHESHMFHTDSGDSNNYIYIKFNRTIKLDSLIAYNTTYIDHKIRINYLSLDLLLNNEIIQTIKSKEWLKNKTIQLTNLLKNVYNIDYNILYYITSIFIKVEYQELLTDFIQENNCKKYNINLQTLIDIVNQRAINKSFILQYTNGYGWQKTFNIWTHDELYNYLVASRAFIDILYQLNSNVFYAFGTLLGFVREHNFFIPHDHDIDIIIIFPISQYKDRNTLRRHLEKFFQQINDIKIVNFFIDHFHVQYKNSQIIDIFHCLEDENGFLDVYPQHRGKYLHSSYLYPTIDMNVWDIVCPLPKNPFKFLEVVYGSNWKTPIDKNFHDPNA